MIETTSVRPNGSRKTRISPAASQYSWRRCVRLASRRAVRGRGVAAGPRWRLPSQAPFARLAVPPPGPLADRGQCAERRGELRSEQYGESPLLVGTAQVAGSCVSVAVRSVRRATSGSAALPASSGPDRRVGAEPEERLVLLVPADAVVLVPGVAQHLEDDARARRLSGRVAVDDDDVARLGCRLCSSAACLPPVGTGPASPSAAGTESAKPRSRFRRTTQQQVARSSSRTGSYFPAAGSGRLLMHQRARDGTLRSTETGLTGRSSP